MTRAWVLFLGALATESAAAVFVSKRTAGRRVGPRGGIAVAITTVLSTLAGLAGLLGTQATCYVAGRFSSRHLSREERLTIPDDAVGRGEVDQAVADRARAHIGRLSE